MANAAEELKGPIGFNWQGFASAANYALQNKTNYEQALKWIDQAIAQNNVLQHKVQNQISRTWVKQQKLKRS